MSVGITVLWSAIGLAGIYVLDLDAVGVISGIFLSSLMHMHYAIVRARRGEES